MKNTQIKNMVGLALITAIVVVLQLLGSFIKFGTFSISLVLVPIIVGAALYGVKAGGWLGFVFGVTVILSGDAALFMPISVPGTIATVIVKGIAAGLLTGIVYKLFEKKNTILATAVSAVVCPVVNTGVFLLGCIVFFLDTVAEWAGSQSTAEYMIVGLVGLNFVAELVINVLLAPVIVRIVKIGKKM